MQLIPSGKLKQIRLENIMARFLTNSILIPVLMVILASPSFAQEAAEEETIPPVLLSELAAQADMIALVRVLDTDYEYTREFPSGGTAFLEVLIPYKVTRPLEDIIEVYEEGLHAGECYFENPSVLEEGQRHLVFLKFSDDVKEQYNGMKQGCKLEALVRQDGRYALRYPLNGIELADDLNPLAEEMVFQDANAVLDDEEITPDTRNELVQNGYLVAIEQRFEYTHGIELTEIRKLLGPEGLTLDRSLKK
jgi:hypothetical protein